MLRNRRFLASISIVFIIVVLVGINVITHVGIAHGATQTITTPSNVQATATGSNYITLSWSASTDNSGTGDQPAYYVYNGANIVATSMDSNGVTVSSLLPSTTYTFTVEAYDVNGNTSAQSSPVTAATSAASGSVPYQKTAYFDQWSIYSDGYYPSTVATSGAASQLTTMIYAFENIDPVNLTCFETIKAADTNESNPNAGDGAGDAFADYQKSYSTTVNGVGDVYSQPIKGNFNQLRELKAKYPNLKILLSLGGWTYSKYFSDAAATQASRQKFVSSCIDMFIKGNLPTGISGDPSGGAASAAGIFDGIDIDWEYPGVPGHTGNHYGPQDTADYTALLQEFRTELDTYGTTVGKHFMLMAAVSSGQDKIAMIQTNLVGQYLDYADVMTYDMHGAWESTTNLQDPIYTSPNDPSATIPPGNEKYSIDTAITAWTKGLTDYSIPGGFPANKITLGFPEYYRGWTGVPAGSNHGLYQSSTGPTAATGLSATAGIAYYRDITSLVTNSGETFYDPTTQATWFYDGNNMYTGDTPQSISNKVTYLKNQSLGGAMIFSLEDDPSNTLLTDIFSGLGGSPCQTNCPTPTPQPTSTPTPLPTSTATPISGTPTPTNTPAATNTPSATSTPVAENLVVNGGFESGDLTGWSCSPVDAVVTSPVHSGNYALADNTTSTDNGQCTQTISVQPNTNYTLSAYANGNYTYLGVTNGASTWTSGNGYSLLSIPFTTTSTQTSIQIYIHGWYGQGTAYFDDIALVGPGGTPTATPVSTNTPAPTATGTPIATNTPSATSTPSPTNTPAPTSTPIAGNLVVNGGFETGDLTGWTCDAGTTITANPVHSGKYALQLNPTSSLDGQCSQTITVQANHTYTLSAYVDGAYAYLGVTGGTSTWTSSSAYTQLSVTVSTGSSTSITIYVHGWYSQGSVYVDDVTLQ